MDRRNFLRAMVGGVATAAAVRTWPFRVYSFPATSVITDMQKYFDEDIFAEILPLDSCGIAVGDLLRLDIIGHQIFSYRNGVALDRGSRLHRAIERQIKIVDPLKPYATISFEDILAELNREQ